MILTKIALDVNIPQRLVRMLRSGFGDQGFEFIWEPEFAPAAASDEFWAVAFKRFGGKVVITGDKNIGRRPHQVLAFKDNGFICFFCDRNWASEDLTFKVAHLLYWWPRIQAQIAISQPEDCWWIPVGIRSNQDFRKLELPSHVIKAVRAGQPSP